ncbi:hypothetical protein JCM6882_004831 [Rhodosporidiobolus microsporus]
MSSNVRPPSPFDKLPLELLKRIVELVKEQDVAFEESFLTRADPDVGVIHVRRTTRTLPLEGKWSSWCGRGMAALSLANKQFRGLTFLSLCEAVTLKQLASPMFRFELVNRQEVITSVRVLDLRTETGKEWAAVAPFFSRLAITRLIVGSGSLAVVSAVDFRVLVSKDKREAAFVEQAFQHLLRQVIVVETHDITVSHLERLMAQLCLPKIRQMRTLYRDGDADDDALSFADANPQLVPLFQQLVGLETFELQDEGTWATNYAVDPSWTGLSLPSLSSVTVRARRGPASLCELFKAATPNLRTLRIDGFDSEETFTLPDLPSLCHFAIETSGAASFTIPPTIRLLTLAVEIRGRSINCQTYIPAFDTLPPSLRLITLRIESTTFPQDASAFRTKCASRGITFRLVWTPNTVAMEYALPEMLFGSTPPADTLHLEPAVLAAAHETLEWAKGRLEWCERFGDDRTAQEIITALTRVRERQALDLQ